MTRFLLLFVLIASSASAQITDVMAQNELFEFIQKAEQVTLFSIDPTDPQYLPAEKQKASVEKFRGYVVLGKIAGLNAQTPARERIRSILVSALISPEETYECFEPRLAVRLQTKDRVMEILLCYQCHQSRFFLGDEWQEGPLGSVGEKEFNALLDQAGIARDKPKPRPRPEDNR